MRHYHAFGLRIASELELSELHPSCGPADVRIFYREVAAAERDADLDWLEGQGETVRLHLDGIAFTVTAGQRIDIDAPPGTPPADVRIRLLGSVIAALLSQRGRLTIHANLIALAPHRAMAFAAESGGGKSTLAAWFEQRGYAVLADDLCAMQTDAAGTVQAFEGIPRLKLWGESLRAFGRNEADLERVATAVDKYHVPLHRARDEGSLDPLPLERMYLLGRAEEGKPLAIEHLHGADAAAAVLRNIYRWQIGQRVQRDPRAQFDQCLALARYAAVFRVRRRWGMQWFDEDAEAIERHLIAPVEDARKD
ncbi:MAG: hypothetical protein ABIP91_02735 [Sphingomicrobium sp.]